MNFSLRVWWLILLVSGVGLVRAQPPAAPQLQSLVDRAAQTALETYRDKKLLPAQLAITLVRSATPRQTVLRMWRPGVRISSPAPR